MISIPFFLKIMWDNFRVRKWYYTIIILSQGKPPSPSTQELSHFLLHVHISWPRLKTLDGLPGPHNNVLGKCYLIVHFIICHFQYSSYYFGYAIAISTVFLLDEATKQPSWKPRLPQSQRKLPVLVTLYYVTLLYFLPNTYPNLIWLICLVIWCWLIVSPLH